MADNKYTAEEIQKIVKCELHGSRFTNPVGLCHTSNSSGYSTYSPPCNGCKIGQQDQARGLWMSGITKQ